MTIDPTATALFDLIEAIDSEIDWRSLSAAFRTRMHKGKEAYAAAYSAEVKAAFEAAKGEAQPVAWPLGTHVHIDHDGFHGRVIGHYQRDDGYHGVVLQQDGTKVVHVYGLRHLHLSGTNPSPTRAENAQVEPVAWITPSTLSTLMTGTPGAYNKQISNATFSGFTVALYTIPPGIPEEVVEGAWNALVAALKDDGDTHPAPAPGLDPATVEACAKVAERGLGLTNTALVAAIRALLKGGSHVG